MTNGNAIKNMLATIQRDDRLEQYAKLIGVPAWVTDEKGNTKLHSQVERAVAVYRNLITNNPKLAQCTPDSVLNCLYRSAEARMEPGTPLGLCYVIPYGNIATFQFGYQGLKEIAYRSDKVGVIYAETVFENDLFGVEFGTSRTISHKPAPGWPFEQDARGEAVGYYGVIKMRGSNEALFRVWSKKDIEKHAKTYSFAYKQNKKDSPWFTAFDAMAHKTMLLQVLKDAPKTVFEHLSRDLKDAILNDPDIEFPEEETKRKNAGYEGLKDRLREQQGQEDASQNGEGGIPDVDPETGEVRGAQYGTGDLKADIEEFVRNYDVGADVFDRACSEAGIDGDWEAVSEERQAFLMERLEATVDLAGEVA